MADAIILQGNFTSDGNNVFIDLESGADWMYVYNTTQAAASQTTAVGVKYYWQSGFGQGAKWTTFKSNAAAAANLEQFITSNGFSYFDTSVQTPGTLNATITAISNAAIPVVSNSGTNGIAAGSVVRLINVVGAQQFGGMDFTVGINTLTTGTFSLDYAPQIVAGTTGSWRVIPFNPIYYPRRRSVTKITKAAQAVVTMSVTHGYEVGQAIRMTVPSRFGMVEMNGLLGNIVDVDTTNNTITLDINSSAFTTFSFPLTTQLPFSPAEVTPVGENTAVALSFGVDILSDATVNTGSTGILLAGGTNNPGGAASDEIFWVAGKSFSVS